MNRHFFNFVAIFNWASINNRKSFSFPLRNKKIFIILNILESEGVISGYEIPKKLYYNSSGQQIYSKKTNDYYTPVTVHIKEFGNKPIIKTFSKPGKRVAYNWKKLARLVSLRASSDIIVVSSSKLSKICTARQLVPFKEGAVILFAVVDYKISWIRKKNKARENKIF